MTDIEKKALALVNEVSGSGSWTLTSLSHPYNRLVFRSLCKAIEQHEAFRQEVSDAVEHFKRCYPGYQHVSLFDRFIIAKPDPLAECLLELDLSYVDAEDFRAALAKRGGKIVWENEP